MADVPFVLATIPGGVDLRGAGEGPAEILFPLVALAGPASGVVTIQTANVPQALAAARVDRKGWALQNFDEELWWEYTNNPTQYQSFKIDPYAFWICPPSLLTGAAIKILGGRAGQRFCFREAF
ncbi:hypothetical protein [Azohydromonas lata]|uniref:hypothetical protein n=1 Tax=Azohydromonas lata TaxID=45677 RepID=UPI000833EBD4|nr:hypothetical protein [Azohydromonas lata]